MTPDQREWSRARDELVEAAASLGFGKESYVRLRSGLMYTLSEGRVNRNGMEINNTGKEHGRC